MFSAQFIGDIHAEEMPAPSDKWNRVETAAERPDLIVWHMNLLGVNLKPLLTGAPKASVLVVSRGDPTNPSVEEELQKGSYTEQERKRVFGCGEGGSIPRYRDLWPSLVEYFSSGKTTPEVARFLCLDEPVRLMALCAGLEVAKRELGRESPRIGMKELLEPALKLATDAGRNDVHEQISMAINAKVSDPSDKAKAQAAVDQGLRLLRSETKG